MQAYLQGNLNLLTAIAERYHGLDPPPPEVDPFLERVTAANAAFVGIGVTDSRGVVFATSMASSLGLDLSSRSYMQESRRSDAVVVSAGFYSDVADETIITINVPVTLAGNARGTVVGAITLNDLAAVLAGLAVGPSGERISVVDQDNQLLVSPSLARTTLLSDLSENPAVETARREGAGALDVQFTSEVRLVTYVPLDDPNWVIFVSQTTPVAYAAANRIVRRGLLLSALTIGGVLVVAGYLGRSLSRSYGETTAARREAEEALQIREEFLAVAAHELRNPVANVLGASQLLERRLRGTALETRDRDYLHMLMESVTHLGRLVDDLLDVTRLEQGELRMRPERLDLANLVMGQVNAAPMADHPVEVTVPARPLVVLADRDRVTEVIGNLLENAGKYSPARTLVRVEVAAEQYAGCVSVTDQGVGFTPDEASRLFRPFGRTASAQASGVPGLGLGLYIAKGIAEAHHGTLTASSPGRGQGSTFKLTLPLASAQLPPPPGSTIEA